MAGVPAGVHRPEHFVLVADIGDVRIAVDEQRSGLAIALLLQLLPELADGRFCRHFAGFGHDRAVDRCLLQLGDLQGFGAGGVLDLAEEIALEVDADPIDLHAVGGLSFIESEYDSQLICLLRLVIDAP